MPFDAWLSVAVVVATFLVLATSRIPPYLALSGALGTLVVLGVLPPTSAFVGFANDGVITIAVLFIVAAGLRQTGALSFFVRLLLGRPRTERRALLRLSLPATVGSAFLNNTPVVAMLLPAVIDWCRASNVSPSRLLLPLSYFAILGGLCTLIGTSTNLAVNGLMIAAGYDGLGVFALAPVGLVCAVLGVAMLAALAPRWLSERSVIDESFGDPRRYSVEMVVAPRGPLVGRSVEDAGLRRLPRLFLAEIHRGDRVLPAVEPTERLHANDQLVFVGVVDSVVDLLGIAGLEPATAQVFKLDTPRVDRIFAEAVLSARGPLIGKTIREGRFRSRYGAVVLAVSRNGERVSGRIGDIELRAGDTLFVESTRDFPDRWRNSPDFFLVSALDGTSPSSNERAPVAIGILSAMVLTSATGVLSILQAAIVAAGLMLVTRCCSEHAARRSIDGALLIALASAFGLGAALRDTGAAAAVGGSMIALAGDSPELALIAVFIATTLVSELVTNNAAAVVFFPIAVAAAERLGVSFVPFAVVVMFAASASFATPIGYQTNLMVYGPGGYRFSDFVWLGVPMKILVGVVALVMVPAIWPF